MAQPGAGHCQQGRAAGGLGRWCGGEVGGGLVRREAVRALGWPGRGAPARRGRRGGAAQVPARVGAREVAAVGRGLFVARARMWRGQLALGPGRDADRAGDRRRRPRPARTSIDVGGLTRGRPSQAAVPDPGRPGWPRTAAGCSLLLGSLHLERRGPPAGPGPAPAPPGGPTGLRPRRLRSFRSSTTVLAA